MAHSLLFLAIALVIFLPFTVVAWRALVAFHPRRRALVTVAAVAGNLMWPWFLTRRIDADWRRIIHAALAPPWFAWLTFAIVYCALVLLLWLAWLPLRRRMRFAEFGRIPSRVFLWVVIVGAIAGVWQALVPLRVETVPVHIARLPPSLIGKRIVLLGDLHVGWFTRRSRLDKLFSTAASLRPDAVVLAGDLVDDDPHYVPKLLAGTRALPASVPLVAVLGNHEMYGDPYKVIAGLRGSRIRLLVNEGVPVGDLWIAGISDYAAGQRKDLRPDLPRALAAKPASSLPLVVAHQPGVIDEVAPRGLPLAVCAHTHGGQFGFRPLRWSLAGLFLRYHMGLYRVRRSQLFITTGAGYWVLPFRLGMSPEIIALELRR
ncbi:MAG TPA: metallophosphoesterase [Thermoanaerobaculia bacterium]|jgi:hypothetical protein